MILTAEFKNKYDNADSLVVLTWTAVCAIVLAFAGGLIGSFWSYTGWAGFLGLCVFVIGYWYVELKLAAIPTKGKDEEGLVDTGR